MTRLTPRQVEVMAGIVRGDVFLGLAYGFALRDRLQGSVNVTRVCKTFDQRGWIDRDGPGTTIILTDAGWAVWHEWEARDAAKNL